MDTSQATNIKLSPANNLRLANLCGPCNDHIRKIEAYFGIEVYQRGHIFHLIGPSQAVSAAKKLLQDLYQQANNELTIETIYSFMRQYPVHTPQLKKIEQPQIITRSKTIQTITQHQANYVENMRTHAINFAIGPAGTGKTYLAVACGIEALEKGQIQRLVFVRPAVEAGERLGFLPGDLEEKVLPYLRPLYDALYDMLGVDDAQKLIERNIIEIAPLAFMRGRTLTDAFIILDEAQNTTVMQMKMFLTRLGFGSTAVAAGDISQVDLPNDITSGLQHATTTLKSIQDISVTYFDAQDAVRHPLVNQIITAYENNELSHHNSKPDK